MCGHHVSTTRSVLCVLFFFFSSRRRHTRCSRDWSSDVCSSDLPTHGLNVSFVSPSGNWGYSDRKSTRLNSSHGYISYAVFCLKKKKKNDKPTTRDRHTAPRRLTDTTVRAR